MLRADARLLLLAASMAAGCTDPNPSPTQPPSPRPPAPQRWSCPETWVPYARGGCGPAVVLCAPGGEAAEGACAGSDVTRPVSTMDADGTIGTRLYRLADGRIGGAWPEGMGGPPDALWMPEGLPPLDRVIAAGVTSCPAGWSRRADRACDPNLSTACPPGAWALPGGACTATSLRDCPAGEYAAIPAEAVGQRVVYVRADAMPAGDGTPQRPFNSLTAGLAAAGSSGWVLVAAGDYAPIAVTGSAHVIGACAARVTVTGSPTPSTTLAPSVLAEGSGASLDLRGVTVREGAGAVVARDGAALTLRAVRVESAREFGVGALGAGARITLDDVAIVAPRVAPTTAKAHGVVVGRQASADLTRVVIEGARGYGLDASGVGTRVDARDLWITDTSAGRNDAGVAYGASVAATSGARVTVERASLRRSTVMGAVAGEGASLTLASVTLEDTRPAMGADGESYGMGLVALARSTVDLRDVALVDNYYSGLLASGTVTLRGVLVRGTREPRSTLRAVSPSAGVTVLGGGRVVAEGLRCQANQGIGIRVEGLDSRLDATDLVLSGTRPFSDGTSGYGLLVRSDARATVARSLVDDNRAAGVVANGPGALLVMTDTIVRGTLAGPPGRGRVTAVGAAAQDSGRIEATRVRFVDGFGTGIGADSYGELALVACSIERTSAATEVVGTPHDYIGQAMTLTDRGRATIVDTALVDNARYGIGIDGAGTVLSLAGSVIRGTGLSDDAPRTSFTLAVRDGAVATVARTRFVQNRVTVGATSHGANATLSLEDCVIDDVRPTREEASALGVQAARGASLRLARSRVSGSHTAAASAYHPGTQLTMTDVALTGTLPGTITGEPAAGVGLVVGLGASMTLRRGYVADNRQVGAWATDPNTTLTLTDVLVTHTSPFTNGALHAYGAGLVAQAGARVDARRVAVTDVHGAAVMATLADVPGERIGGASVRAEDLFVRSVASEVVVLRRASPPASYGVHVGSGCTLEGSRAVIDGAEWGFFQSAGALTLRAAVVVRQTRGVGASNGATAERPLVLEAVTSSDVAGPVARDIELPEALLPSPPAP